MFYLASYHSINQTKLSDSDKNILQFYGHIIPVGYQPFSRSRAQSAYMLMPISSEYDMMKDTCFAKLKFRLTENLCEWIYQEMDRGRKIYPKTDVPDLEKYISEIAKIPTVFSRSTFNFYCEKNKLTSIQADVLEKNLLCYGYIISKHDLTYISDKEARKLNKKYNLEYITRKFKIKPSARPFWAI